MDIGSYFYQICVQMLRYIWLTLYISIYDYRRREYLRVILHFDLSSNVYPKLDGLVSRNMISFEQRLKITEKDWLVGLPVLLLYLKSYEIYDNG